MAMSSPLFPGDSEIDELFKVFRVLGTPNDTNWPGVSLLPDYKKDFPNWPSVPLSKIVPQLESDGIDLLQVFFLVINLPENVSIRTGKENFCKESS